MSNEVEKMTDTMDKSILVQRLNKPIDYASLSSFGGGLENGGLNKEAMKQLEEIFSFDYMGSAEFEFGALPETLSRIWDNSTDFIRGSMKVGWKTTVWKTGEVKQGNDYVYYLCHKGHTKEVKKRIASWARGERGRQMTKECVNLSSSFHDRQHLGWIEFDNGFFFFIDKEMCDKTQELFEI